MNCADATASEVDAEIMKILKDSYKEAKRLLKENREVMDKLAEYLIEKETITGKEFMEIFRREKGLPEPEETKEEAKEADSVDGNRQEVTSETEAISVPTPSQESTDTSAEEQSEIKEEEPEDMTVEEPTEEPADMTTEEPEQPQFEDEFERAMKNRVYGSRSQDNQ